MTYARYITAALQAIPVSVAFILVAGCQQPTGDRQAGQASQHDVRQEERPVPIRDERLAAGARAFFWDSVSTVTVVADTLMRIDGFLMLEIDRPHQSVNLRSSLMRMRILEYPLLARIDAHDVHAGQSIEVFSGALSVRKAYESPWDDIDTLRAGDLYMINKDIDLSEKERLDDTTFGTWWADHRAGRDR